MMKNNPILIVFLTVFVDLIGFGILIPVLPFLLVVPNKFNLLPVGFGLQNAYIIFGFLLASYAFGQFLATPILGQLSDKLGRRKVLAFSLAGTCISYILFAIGILTKNIPLLFVARGFDGLTGGNISVAQAVIADISTTANRAKNFGIIGAAFGLGFVCGPYLGGKLSVPSVPFLDLGFVRLLTPSWFDATTPFWFAAILAFFNTVFVLIALPETNKFIDNSKSINWTKSLHNIQQAFKIESVKVQLASVFLYQAGFTFFTTFAGTYFATKFLFSQSSIGDFYGYIGVCIVIVQALIVRRVSAKFQEYQVLKTSLVGAGLSVLLYVIVPANMKDLLWLVVPFFALFQGLSQANNTALISKSAGRENQGQILGISSSVQALAQAIPPILSGFLVSGFGNPSISLIIASVVMVSGGIVFNLYYKPNISANQ